MAPDGKPALPAFNCSVEKHIRDGRAPLPPRAEAGQGRIPNHLSGAQRLDLRNPIRPPISLPRQPRRAVVRKPNPGTVQAGRRWNFRTS